MIDQLILKPIDYFRLNDWHKRNGERHLANAISYASAGYPDRFYEGSMRKAIRNFDRARPLAEFIVYCVNNAFGKIQSGMYQVAAFLSRNRDKKAVHAFNDREWGMNLYRELFPHLIVGKSSVSPMFVELKFPDCKA
jgi:hypothetical protein